MGRFAEGTTVDVGKSQAEIQSILKRYGATGYAYAEEMSRAGIKFKIQDRMVRFILPLPTPMDEEFKRDGRGYARKPNQKIEVCEAEARRRWRCLVLCIKSKLECVASGVVTFEEEFMAHLVLPGGQTMAEQVLPEYQKAIESGRPLPPLLGM